MSRRLDILVAAPRRIVTMDLVMRSIRRAAIVCAAFVLCSCPAGVPRQQALREDRPLVRVVGMQERGGGLDFLPVGASSDAAARDLSAYFEERLGVRSAVLPVMEMPASARDPKRRQIVGETLIAEISKSHPDQRGDVIVAVTDEDLWSRESGYLFVFSLRDWNDVSAVAVVSTARMDPRFFRRPADPEWLRARLRKMATKNVGMLYYGLKASGDPGSALSASVGGIDDLDRMGFGF